MVGALFGDIQCIEYSRRRMFFRKRSFPLPLCTPHSCFYFNFEFRVMSFSPTVTLYVWLCYACFPCFLSPFSSQDRSLPESIPFVSHAFFRREIHKNRIFQASLITLRTTFEFSCEFFFVSSGLQDISVRLANYGYHQLWAIKRKSYEGTLVELIESSGFRGWHEFNEDS